MIGRKFSLISCGSITKPCMPRSAVLVSPFGKFILSSVKPPKGYAFPKSMQRQLLDLLELASARTFETPAALALDIDPEWIGLAAELLPAGPDYVGLAPGSGGRPKCWPLDNFIELARDIALKGRAPVFILGPQEDGWRAEIQAAVPDALFPLQAAQGGDHGALDPAHDVLGAAQLLDPFDGPLDFLLGGPFFHYDNHRLLSLR